jgi:hypothetical protein
VSDEAQRVGFRDVFALGEFRSLWSAQLLSVAGDQLAKIALTVLVYDRTGSPVLAALTFATSFVPAFLGGLFLSGLGDRLPRRGVMIGCDLTRMVLAGLMAVPGVPLPVLVALLFLVTMIGAPFTAARSAIYPTVLGASYQLGTAVTLTTNQLAQVIGFAGGGVMTGLLGARPCLIADSATFAASALLLWLGVAARPADGAGGRTVSAALSGLVAGTRLVFADPALRVPMLFGWLAAIYNSYEGIAAPWGRELGGGAVTTGLLLAFPAGGYTISTLLFPRFVGPRRRSALMGPLAVGCSALLIPIAMQPGLGVSLALLAASGVCQCFQASANASFVQAAPAAQRSQAFGLAAGGMSLGQGAAMALAGAAAEYHLPATVVGASGVVGVVAALWLVLPLALSGPARSRFRPGAGG